MDYTDYTSVSATISLCVYRPKSVVGTDFNTNYLLNNILFSSNLKGTLHLEFTSR
jgi:hypothetical protein